ncbi:Peroxisomal leader peptide-processing protease [Blattella germanica]|nr:Peroxisomal leader peptide-processing protease [Blattella germanica]
MPGDPVIAAGFPLFSEEENNRPTLTRGIVAHLSEPMAMMQTTCCIQSGASGGALFGSTGEVVGLISCNTQDVSSKAHYPHINMAVPACVVVQPLREFLRTGDTRHLNVLESRDTTVQRIWKMQDMLSKL